MPSSSYQTKGKKPVETDISTNIGQNLQKLRKQHHMTQKEVAEKLDITYQQLQKYETGRNRIPIESLLILLDLFNVPYDYFLNIARNPNDKRQEDIRLSSYLLKSIQKVKTHESREKIMRVIDILCS